jgi:hypothetical protein
MDPTTVTRSKAWLWALHEFSKPAAYMCLGAACIHLMAMLEVSTLASGYAFLRATAYAAAFGVVSRSTAAWSTQP